MERRVFGPAVFANLNSQKKKPRRGDRQRAVKLQREGLFRELKRRKAYEKPSERRAREKRRGNSQGKKGRGSSLNAKV